MWVDPLTQGLWVVSPSESHPATNASRTQKVTSIYELDENQTQHLISLAFSTKPREKAAAKLNLFSRVKGPRTDDMKSDPQRVLSIVFSETELTQAEIKAMVFQKQKKAQPACPSCSTPVELSGVTYHPECDVIKWLMEIFFFIIHAKSSISRSISESDARNHSTVSQNVKQSLQDTRRCEVHRYAERWRRH